VVWKQFGVMAKEELLSICLFKQCFLKLSEFYSLITGLDILDGDVKVDRPISTDDRFCI
jgi:hypothetical protein